MKYSKKRQARFSKKRKTHKKRIGGTNFSVQYGSNSLHGQLFTKEATQQEPTVFFTRNPQKQYSLIMWDPDVPKVSQPGWLHWMATNLSSPQDLIEHTIVPYHGPNPPSGTHRYFFGLFEQAHLLQVQPPNRPQFDIDSFIKQNKLTLLSKLYMMVSK